MPSGVPVRLRAGAPKLKIEGKMIKNHVLYLYSEKEDMVEEGEELGLTGDALDMFRHTLAEVKFDVETDTETGESFAIAVNGIKLNESISI